MRYLGSGVGSSMAQSSSPSSLMFISEVRKHFGKWSFQSTDSLMDISERRQSGTVDQSEHRQLYRPIKAQTA